MDDELDVGRLADDLKTRQDKAQKIHTLLSSLEDTLSKTNDRLAGIEERKESLKHRLLSEITREEERLKQELLAEEANIDSLKEALIAKEAELAGLRDSHERAAREISNTVSELKELRENEERLASLDHESSRKFQDLKMRQARLEIETKATKKNRKAVEQRARLVAEKRQALEDEVYAILAALTRLREEAARAPEMNNPALKCGVSCRRAGLAAASSPTSRSEFPALRGMRRKSRLEDQIRELDDKQKRVEEALAAEERHVDEVEDDLKGVVAREIDVKNEMERIRGLESAVRKEEEGRIAQAKKLSAAKKKLEARIKAIEVDETSLKSDIDELVAKKKATAARLETLIEKHAAIEAKG